MPRCSALLIAVFLCVSSVLASGAAWAVEARFERMAALQESVVTIHEKTGMPCLFTYDHDPALWLGNIVFGKLKVGVRGGTGTDWLCDAKDLTVRNIPTGEGVEAVGTVGGARVQVEAIPTDAGRRTTRWEGSAVFKVTCSLPSRLALEFGGARRVWIVLPQANRQTRPEWMRQPNTLAPAGTEAGSGWVKHETNGRAAYVGGVNLPMKYAVSFWSAQASVEVGSEGDQIQGTSSDAMSVAYVTVAFAESSDRAAELACADPRTSEASTRALFHRLADSAWVSTGHPKLDSAFAAAVRNLEYAWVKPYGWIEAIHHWGTLYSQQQNLAADWLGQQDRSRDMLLTHAAKLLADGQVPQLDPYGRPRQDFGGWNQFYVWGVQHYWRHTGDEDFLKRIREPLARVVDQTFQAHDADGNGLLGFGQQIGNQEDYISTPEGGTSPTIAGIEMKRVQAELAGAMGKPDEARAYEQQALRMSKALRQDLWNTQLGRFTFYKDSLGVDHLDGQYHTLIWPVLFDLLDPLDSYTSMRHLDDTLTQNRVYTSNNFPNHVVATAGSQAGGQQQPWATLGWAKLGNAQKAILPLEWIAGWVMDEANAGSWPEVAEDMPAYFTPPAGVYVQGVVEGLFGLRLDKPNGVLYVSPCLPDCHSSEFSPAYKMHLPEYDVTVTQSPFSRTCWRRIECKSAASLRHVYRVAIPPSTNVVVRANGKLVAFKTEAGVGVSFVSLSLPKTTRSVVSISWRPLMWCCGSLLPSRRAGWSYVKATGVSIEQVVDRSGSLAEWAIEGGTAKMRVRPDASADHYGKMGRFVLSRRTIFLYVRPAGGSAFWYPVDFTPDPRPAFDKPPTLTERDGKWNLDLDVVGWPGGQRATVELGGRSKLIKVPGPCSIALEDRDLVAVDPGMNAVTVFLEDGTAINGRFDGSPLMNKRADIRAYAEARVRRVALPKELLSPDTDWHNWRWWSAYGHYPWAALEPPLQGLDGKADLAPECCPGLTFANPSRQVAVVSRHLDRPSITIPVYQRASKVYLLLLPMLDNHDVFAPVGRVSVRCEDRLLFARTLHFPGDLDWWGPKRILGGFATVGAGWSDSPAWEAPSSVINVVEVDLKGMRDVESVTVETIGRYPALAVVGVSLLGSLSADSIDKLTASVRQFAEAEPRVLFPFDDASLESWEVTGTCWGISSARGDHWGRRSAGPYFADSMVGGESAVGTITSPTFATRGSQLTFMANGHGARNYYALVDAATGTELMRSPAPEKTGPFVKITWDVQRLRGREVRFKAVDAESGSAYAWIAFDEITVIP